MSGFDLMLISFELFGKSISTPVNSSAVTFGIVPVGKSVSSNFLPYGSTYSTLALGSASSVNVISKTNLPEPPVDVSFSASTRISTFWLKSVSKSAVPSIAPSTGQPTLRLYVFASVNGPSVFV